MSAAIDTLLYQIRNGAFDIKNKHIAFLNTAFHHDLNVFDGADLTLQQYFKPYEEELVKGGFSVSPDIPENKKSYDLVCILLPKNMVEARYLIARGACLLRPNGALLCAADNKSGGSRIKKLLHNFGFDDLQEDARNKARAVWGRAHSLNNDEIETALSQGEEQGILDGEFISRAGIFGWDKIDKGSQILSKYIPTDIKGKGADFGCGYGYLSHFLLSNCKKVKQLYCIDADYRAVHLCRKNLEKFECKKEFLWQDLTKTQDDFSNLDFIIMNPPFHENKKLDISIGQSFIATAHMALRRGGKLFMVANNHLAYEDILKVKFFECHKLYEGKGFKVFCAVK